MTTTASATYSSRVHCRWVASRKPATIALKLTPPRTALVPLARMCRRSRSEVVSTYDRGGASDCTRTRRAAGYGHTRRVMCEQGSRVEGARMKANQGTVDVAGLFGSPDGSRAELDDVLSEFVEFDADPGLRWAGHPGRRLQGTGDRRQARRRQDRLHATVAGPPGARGVGLRTPARVRPADHRGGRHRRAVVRRPGARREVGAGLGPGDPAGAHHPPAAAPGAAAPCQRGAPGRDPGRLRPAARRGAPAPGRLLGAGQRGQRAGHRPAADRVPQRPAVGRPEGPAGRGPRPRPSRSTSTWTRWTRSSGTRRCTGCAARRGCSTR